MKKTRQRKAFTIVEMSIVIAVIAILAAVAIPVVGGIIKNANKSADEQFAGSLSVQLALWEVDKNREIKNEDDLYEAVKSYYGDETDEVLTPKSGKYGFNYWYDPVEKRVILQEFDKLPDGADGMTMYAGDDVVFELAGDGIDSRAASQNGFSSSSLRSISKNGRTYFLVDKAGSEIVKILNDFDNLSSESEYQTLVNNLSVLAGEKDVYDVYDAVLDKVKQTAIVIGAAAYRYENLDNIKSVYVPKSEQVINVQTIYQFDDNYEVDEGTKLGEEGFDLAKSENVKVVHIPVGMKVASNGFPSIFECADPSDQTSVNNATVFEIATDDISKLTDNAGNFMFDVQINNPIFKLKNSNTKYVIINDKVYVAPYTEGDTAVNVGTLGTTTLENLEVKVTFPEASKNLGEGTHYYDSVQNILYVKYDQPSVPITVLNANYVNWTYELVTGEDDKTTDLISVVGNELKINNIITLSSRNQVNVIGKINDEVKASFTVYLVMPREVQVDTFNSTNNSADIDSALPLVLNYDTTDTFTFTFSVGYGANGKVSAWDIAVDSKNGKFTPTLNDEKNQITIKLNEYSFDDVLVITIGTETVKQTFTIKIQANDKSGVAFEKASFKEGSDVKVGDNYLFRVGNKNGIKVDKLFYTSNAYSEVAMKFYDYSTANHPVIGGNVACNQTVTVVGADSADGIIWTVDEEVWKNVNLTFAKTGVVKIEIGRVVDETFVPDRDVLLEVVDGTNVTKYSELKGSGNRVLWADITMSSNDTYSLSNATLFGNGYTFNVEDGAYKATTNGYTSEMYVISLNNATLDNVKVVGKVYTEFNITGKSDYNRAIVLSSGNSSIYNSYISNGAAPVRIYTGTLVIDNTTLKGGSFANLDIHGGQITLKDVTTINQVNGNDLADDGTTTPIGLGIAVWYESVSEDTTITVEGTLTQYNYIAKNQTEYLQNDYAKAFADKMFTDSNVAPYRYNDGTTTWVNTGILSMIDAFGDGNLKPEVISGYGKITVSAYGKTGMLSTVVTDASNYKSAPSAWIPTEQEELAPTFEWDWTSKNYMEKTDGSNDYCYYDGSKVLISMDEGDDAKQWDVSILNAKKLGNTLSYRVFMNDIEYTGDSIDFSVAGDYTIKYVVTDPYNYDVNGVAYDKEYTKTITISVSVIKAAAKNASFDFGGSGYDTVTIGNDTYIMPKTGNSITINGTTVRYVMVDCEPSNGSYENGKLDYWKMIFPVFHEVITITDYADGGTGTEVVYGSSTTSLPAGLTLAGYVSSGSTVPTGAKTFKAETEAKTIFKYASSTEADNAPSTQSSKLVYKSPELSNNARSEGWLLVKYQYKDNTGKTYYYVVCYHTPEMTVENSSPCVTPDTLVTLADGTQKMIKDVTYEDQLLVWNFYTGEYDVMPSTIVMNHGYDTYIVVSLNFSDGTTVKTINGHGFFDVGERKYVILNDANVANYIGHQFAKVDGDGYTNVTLDSYSITAEYTESWSILTAEHYNCILENMWTLTPAEVYGSPDYLMPFEIGEDMKYDEAKMQADIEKYGLYTYEDFAEYCTYEQFVAFGFDHFKVSVEKGYITWEQIEYLLDLHLSGNNK